MEERTAVEGSTRTDGTGPDPILSVVYDVAPGVLGGFMEGV